MILEIGGWKMKKTILGAALLTLLLVGCKEEVDTLASGEMPAIVEVDIQSPTRFNVGETVQLSAYVSQGGKAVNDADEVLFEVWESGFRDDGVKLTGKLDGKGLYIVEHEFEHDGVYYMFAHTTARGMHVMPKIQLIVGNPDMSKVIEDKSTDKMDHSGH